MRADQSIAGDDGAPRAAPAPDAIVVGAGLIGAACAAELAAGGLRVLVLDGRFPSAGTTAEGMGHLVVMEDSPAQLALTSLGVRLWRALRAEMSPRVEWDDTGTLWLAEDDAQLRAAREKAEVYRSAGVRAEVLDAAAVAACEPALRPGLAGALRVPDDAVVYPPGAVDHLLERVVAGGGRVETGAQVTALGPHTVTLGAETRTAEFVVNATGYRSPELTPGLPVRPRRGHLAITDRYPGTCRHELVELGYLSSAHGSDDVSVAFNLQPRSTGQLLIGSSREFVGAERAVNPPVLARMLERATHFLPSIGGMDVIRVWTGLRPATPDHLPLIGSWPEVEGLWIATGHEGLGITTATSTGALLADMVLGREPRLDPAPYRPDRGTSWGEVEA